VVRCFAVIGVLVQAGLVVWHSAAVLRSMQRQDALAAAALAAICTGGRVSEVPEQQPDLPSHGGDQGACPICMGCVPSVAILPSPNAVVQRYDAGSERMELAGESIARRLARVRPPARGPPLLA
jgi:hypothetical protein